jgi:hypothetical protein
MSNNGLVRRTLLCGVVGFFALVAAGCTRYVFKHKAVATDTRHIVSVDAKQRAILASKDSFCSEPSPDVFSVVAQALSFGGTFGRSADPKAVEAALQAAFSSAEQGSTIPRTQTVNMLRELMFRTCERFLNGGYDKDQLSVQAVRDQRLMVSILAIEQLTGAVAPKPVTISASGSSSQGGGGEGLVRLDDAKKELTEAEKARGTAQEKFTKLDKGEEHYCKTLEDAEKVAQEDETKPLTDDQKAELEECRNAQKNLTAAKDRETRAREHHGDLRRLATGLGGSTATETSSTASGGLDQAREISGVVNAVREIVGLNFTDGTEVMLFCLQNLKVAAQIKAQGVTEDKTVKEQREALEATCLSTLETIVDTQKARFAAEGARADAEAASFRREVEVATRDILAVSNDVFDKAWPGILKQLNDATAREALVARIKKKLTTSEQTKVDCLNSSKDQKTIRDCYLRWPRPARAELVTPGE